VISRGRHQKGDVAAALDRAQAVGFKVEPDKNGHRWGWVICCTCGDKQYVSGTPKSPSTEAKKIDQFVRKHRH